MLKKALPKPIDVCYLDIAQRCLHHHLPDSCCTAFFSISQLNSSVTHSKPEQDPESADFTLKRHYPVCQSHNVGSIDKMTACCSGAVKATGFSLTSLKNVRTRCMQHLGQLLQFRRWESNDIVTYASASNAYFGSGGGNRDLKRFLEEVKYNAVQTSFLLKVLVLKQTCYNICMPC